NDWQEPKPIEEWHDNKWDEPKKDDNWQAPEFNDNGQGNNWQELEGQKDWQEPEANNTEWHPPEQQGFMDKVKNLAEEKFQKFEEVNFPEGQEPLIMPNEMLKKF
ncbi:hypothetical protein HOL46_00545, partial [Candidatus Falkowbacteria bacterium]|nr:hypothetical protein [Candidatus Falkowbacteria bacterium]